MRSARNFRLSPTGGLFGRSTSAGASDRQALPIRSPDPDVIQKAQALDAVLLSLNGDFSDIVSYPPDQFRGIIAIQLHNHPETIPTLMRRLLTFLKANPEPAFYHGKLLIVEAHRIRIRQ